MKSDSEEGEIGRGSADTAPTTESERSSDGTGNDDHLVIKPPQKHTSFREVHVKSDHRTDERKDSRKERDYRSGRDDSRRDRERGDDRHRRDDRYRHRHSHDEHRDRRQRDRDTYADYSAGTSDRRSREAEQAKHRSSEGSSRHSSSREFKGEKDKRDRGSGSDRERSSQSKEVLRDAREKLMRIKDRKEREKLSESDEELRKRRERLLAAMNPVPSKAKTQTRERSRSPVDLPAKYSTHPDEDDDNDTAEEPEKTGNKTRSPSTASSEASTEDGSGSTASGSGSDTAEEEGDSESESEKMKRKVVKEDKVDGRIDRDAVDVDSNDDDDGPDDGGNDRTPSAKELKKDEERRDEKVTDIREQDELLEGKEATSRANQTKDEDSQDGLDADMEGDTTEQLVDYFPGIQGCRRVEEFHCLNRIEEGTYGVVYRAMDKQKNEIVALKRLKMEKEKEGFPITSLREINTLLKAQHPNIVTVREIVVGSNMDKIYIVMDYVEHDLKSLMETMKSPFLLGEVKTLMSQLLKAVAHMHDNWILHRDLKTSNLLLSHKGILKVGDFGLAREYGSPLKCYTPIVVTLWYRAPELLLGSKEYSCPIDIWSVGCIFGELLTMKPLFPGKSEVDQLNKIFKDLGTPSEKIWPGYKDLPMVKSMTFDKMPYNTLRRRIPETMLTNNGFNLLNKLLTYFPGNRITAEDALTHEFFSEKPDPIDPEMFPTWPAKSEGGTRKAHSPKPPSGGQQYSKVLADEYGFHMTSTNKGASYKGTGFSLKF